MFPRRLTLRHPQVKPSHGRWTVLLSATTTTSKSVTGVNSGQGFRTGAIFVYFPTPTEPRDGRVKRKSRLGCTRSKPLAGRVHSKRLFSIVSTRRMQRYYNFRTTATGGSAGIPRCPSWRHDCARRAMIFATTEKRPVRLCTSFASSPCTSDMVHGRPVDSAAFWPASDAS